MIDRIPQVSQQEAPDNKITCLLCKETIEKDGLEEHIKEEHRIGHPEALTLLLDFILRERGCAAVEFEMVRPPEEAEAGPVTASPPRPPSPSTSSNDEAGAVTPPDPSSWPPDPLTFISAAERVKLGRRRKKKGEEEAVPARGRRYSTEMKTMISSIQLEERHELRVRRPSASPVQSSENDQRAEDTTATEEQTDQQGSAIDNAVEELLEKEADNLLDEASGGIELHLSETVEAALVEATESEVSKTLDETVDSILESEALKMSETIEQSVDTALEEEVSKTIEEASSTIEEVIDKAVEEAVIETIEEVVEETVQTIMKSVVSSVQPQEREPTPLERVLSVKKSDSSAFGDDIAKIIKEIPSPHKNVVEETSTSDDSSSKTKKPKKKSKRSDSELQKPSKEKHSSKRKSSRISADEEPSAAESWSCTIITEEPEEVMSPMEVKPSGMLSPLEEKPSDFNKTPLLLHSTLEAPRTPMVDEVLCSPRPVASAPTLVDLTEMSQTESADLIATQALLEEISLSVFGVRFRCSLCSFVDEQVRGVRDHMDMMHKGQVKGKVKQRAPVRQGMRVKLKHPRIHKDTLLSAVDYYKSFGGHFFMSETKARIKFWGKEIPKMRDISAGNRNSVSETPAKKQVGPKSWMIKNKLMAPETPAMETPQARRGLGRPGLKRRPKPQDFEVPAINESLEKIGKEILNNDISEVNLFDEIDLDIQNQLLADADGLFSNENTSFDENITGLETVSVDSDFDLSNDIDTNRTRRRKSESSKKVKPLKIKKKITLTKNVTKSDSVWKAVESENLFKSEENVESCVLLKPRETEISSVVEKLRKGDMADDDDSEIENKVPKSNKKRTPPKKMKDESRSRTKTRKMSRLQQLNSLNSSTSRSSSVGSDSMESAVCALSETESNKSLRLRLSSDSEEADKVAEASSTPNGKDPDALKKSILSILSTAVKISKKAEEDTATSKKTSPKTRAGKKTNPKGVNNEKDESSNEEQNFEEINHQVPTVDVSDIIKSPNKDSSKETQKEKTKSLRDFRKIPRKSISEEIKEKRKYSKKGKEMEIPAEMQLPEGSSRYSRSARGKKKQGEALHALLTHLLQILQERDVNEWFSVPINDKIAPGYSKTVKEPMDFTRMENKLDTKVYGTLEQFIYDFKLICGNCLAYHKEDTCYYKAGRKLKHFGRQLLSKQNIKEILEETPGVFSGLTPFELGFDPMGEIEEDDELNRSFHDDSSFSQSPTRYIENNEENHDTMPEGVEEDGVYMTAAERVKFGRRRGQGAQPETPQKTGKRKNTAEENEGGKRLKPMTSEEANEDMTPITGEDAVPKGSLYHHDYFGYTRNVLGNGEEELNPISKAAKEKLRNLQLQRAGGTYVQCCQETCKKWRFLTEYEDPSLVPEYWECNMNKDKKANKCNSRQEGHQVEENEEYVNVVFTAGSLVWARVKGYPWWPAMVDYDPDCEEYYWIEEEESRVDPAWYHVVFLEKQVSRSWVRRELVEKMVDVNTPPKNLAVRKNSASQKSRMAHATGMASNALTLSLEQRLKKYSFANLFKGKWGDYSDISEDEGGGKKSEDKKSLRTPQKSGSRLSVDTPEKKSGLETFVCAKCGDSVIYTKYPVLKHLKKHRMDLKEYVTKFDPQESSDKFVLIREWIDREEFRAAIAEDPWKPNLGEKGSNSDTDRIRTEEEVVVLEQSPRAYLDPAQAEEFHVQSAACKEEKASYCKPPLSNDSLIAVSVRNLDPANKNGASFREIVAFISLHFPYYDIHLDTCRQFVKKAYGLKNSEQEEEPTGTFRIRPAVVQRLYADISPILQNEQAEIEKSMLHSKFLDVMVQRFLEGENYCHPNQQQRLPYDLKQLSLLAFMALKHPASLEQIIIYLVFLFPAFCYIQDIFRMNFGSGLNNEPEMEVSIFKGEERFTIRREAYSHVVKNLRQFTSSKPVFEALKSSIFDENFINVLFPGLKGADTEETNAVLASQKINSNEATIVTNIVSPIQAIQAIQPSLRAEPKPPIPCDILVYYIALLEERKKNKVTQESITSLITSQFDKWKLKDFRFVTEVLKSKVYNQEESGSLQISPHIKSFGTAVVMKFVIENLDDMVAATSSPHSIKTILPRMDEGSAKLQSDFRTQTFDFSKKKCHGWRPPLPESMLMDLAILATADMNDTTTLSAIVKWVQEHFPWYNLTRQTPFSSIPERVPASTDPDSPLCLSSTEAATARQQLQRLALSCRPQLTAIMTQPDVLNCVLEPSTMIPAEDRRYTRPPFPDGVMVGLALLHIGDQYGWASALSIQKFVEMNFPFYEAEMATRFLATISSWLSSQAPDTEYFKVEKEKSGIMPCYQIRADRLLTCFAWMGKYVTFDKESEAVNQLFMKSPSLVKEILSLPPPDWKDYYRPGTAPCIRATPLSKMLAPSTRQDTRLPSLATTSPVVPIVSVTPMEAQWLRPPMETHLMVAMALVLKDCKQFQEQEYDYAPPEDIQVSQFSLMQKNSLQEVLAYMREAFPYYEAKENIREFVINDIQNNKDMVSQFFNLNKNQANKLEYEFKPGMVGCVYEEVLGLADWNQPEAQRLWLRNPRDAETAFGGKAPLSESNILALILFLHGDPVNSYSLCVESIINVMINEVGVASHGLSGQRWGETRLRRFLRETILRLEATGEHVQRDLTNPTPHLSLRSEEGRLDELFANLQKSVFNIINQTRLTDSLRLFLSKFMEMASP